METGESVGEEGPKRKWVMTGVVVSVLVIGAFLVFSFVNREVDITGEVVDSEIAFEGEEMEERKLRIVGVEWKPYDYPIAGEVRGIEADVLHEVFAKLDVPYEIDLIPWSRAVKELELGQADAILATTHNKERESFMMFTPDQLEWGETGEMPENYVYIEKNVFFVRKVWEGSIAYESYDQVARDGLKLGLNQDFSYPEARASDMEIIECVSIENCFNSLLEGEFDMYSVDEIPSLVIAKDMGILEDLAILPKAHFVKPFLLPFSQKSTYPNKEELISKIYDEINNMREDGRYQEIYNKYVASYGIKYKEYEE